MSRFFLPALYCLYIDIISLYVVYILYTILYTYLIFVHSFFKIVRFKDICIHSTKKKNNEFIFLCCIIIIFVTNCFFFSIRVTSGTFFPSTLSHNFIMCLICVHNNITHILYKISNMTCIIINSDIKLNICSCIFGKFFLYLSLFNWNTLWILSNGPKLQWKCYFGVLICKWNN